MMRDDREARVGRVFLARLTPNGSPVLVAVTSVNVGKRKCTVVGETGGMEVKAVVNLGEDGLLKGPDWRRISPLRDIKPWKEALGPAFGGDLLR